MTKDEIERVREQAHNDWIIFRYPYNPDINLDPREHALNRVSGNKFIEIYNMAIAEAEQLYPLKTVKYSRAKQEWVRQCAQEIVVARAPEPYSSDQFDILAENAVSAANKIWESTKNE